ncbi:molybdopterin-guanine dinucleotide biosynthesis protein MobB [Kluyvera intermedia]|uniref:Molybdopterin-guanine dinucleotide biosynthesis protein B n=1 Tax=Kluyvera intermedia TaxID=61648 RepID=A0ABX6DTD5_KLUIN|nr:molybdopterin-guanine dinucleotide biosynthesis protein MobB [Kluyvera intermedia]QGH32082.1 molybdopterin-guanine dinucleotide biosynthesis protein B [Kluyvera intermedia]QGH41064.1 molybdopterin-guanine dinucleotide biosynthesis protein B [Kluyvera intermedia]
MIPLLAIAAWSGTGKTTLLKKLIPELCIRGIRPGLIKHTHHNMDVDKPGKDSYELRKAGAAQTLVASQQRWALMTETPEEGELDLAWLVSRMDASRLDLVLVEGFKHEAVAKILLFREATGHAIDELVIDEHTIAVASDITLDIDVPVLDLNDFEEIVEFIVGWLGGAGGFGSAASPESA